MGRESAPYRQAAVYVKDAQWVCCYLPYVSTCFFALLSATSRESDWTERCENQTATVAYADDLTIFVTKTEEIRIIREALLRYEVASGAKVSIGKSRALTVGLWDTSAQIMKIPYCEQVKILSIHFLSAIRDSVEKSWSKLTARIRGHAQDAYFRDLNPHSGIKYIQDYLIVRAWYTAQIFPPPADSVRQVNSTISWYVWKGGIFRVSLSTHQKGKGEGEWDLINFEEKCRTLLL